MSDVNFSTVKVVAWNSSNLSENSTLWGMAEEQAKLAYKTNSPTSEQIQAQLDQICDDNNFKHLDGTGSGTRDPNLIYTNEPIKVRIDPATGQTSSPTADSLGLTGPAAQQYNAAVTSNNPPGLGMFLGGIPSFDKMDHATQQTIMDLYTRANGDPDPTSRAAKQGRLQDLVHNGGFLNATPGNQAKMLDLLSQHAHEPTWCRKFGQLINSPGFQALPENEQGAMLDGIKTNNKFSGDVGNLITSPGKYGTTTAAQQVQALEALMKQDGITYGIAITVPAHK